MRLAVTAAALALAASGVALAAHPITRDTIAVADFDGDAALERLVRVHGIDVAHRLTRVEVEDACGTSRRTHAVLPTTAAVVERAQVTEADGDGSRQELLVVARGRVVGDGLGRAAVATLTPARAGRCPRVHFLFRYRAVGRIVAFSVRIAELDGRSRGSELELVETVAVGKETKTRSARYRYVPEHARYERYGALD